MTSRREFFIQLYWTLVSDDWYRVRYGREQDLISHKEKVSETYSHMSATEVECNMD